MLTTRSNSPALARTCLLVAAAIPPVCAHAIDETADVRVKQLLKTTRTWSGAPIVYPEGIAEITGVIVEIAPGGATGWHAHPGPSFGFVLEGVLEVKLRSGAVKRIRAGEALAEVIDTQHNGRNVGEGPVKLIVFYAGVQGQPISVRSD